MIAQLFAAAALAAAPTPLLDAPRSQGVAVAGDQVVVTRGGPSGRLRVDALPVAGGPAHRLLTTPKLGPRWTAVSSVSASPERVAVLAGFEKFVDHGPNVSRWRLYTG